MYLPKDASKVPALSTSTSIRPNRSTVAFTAASAPRYENGSAAKETTLILLMARGGMRVAPGVGSGTRTEARR